MRLQRNTGVLVAVVVDESPAFRANILEGDVLLRLGTSELTSQRTIAEVVSRYAGQKVDVQLWRNGEMKSIPVELGTR